MSVVHSYTSKYELCFMPQPIHLSENKNMFKPNMCVKFRIELAAALNLEL